MYKGNLQLLVRLQPPRTPQNGDTFCVYPVEPAGGDDAPLQPVQSSHSNGRLLPQADPERVRLLRRWILGRGQQHSPAGAAAVSVPAELRGAKRLVKIQELVPPVDPVTGEPVCGPLPPVDMICRVLAVDFCHAPGAYVLHVWDGTDAAPVPISYSSSPHEPPQPPRPPPQQQPPGGQLTPAGACGGGGGGAAVGPARPSRKRSSPDEGANHNGSEEREPRPGLGLGQVEAAAHTGIDAAAIAAGAARPPAPPHCSRLHMPLTTVVQHGGVVAPRTSGGGGGSSLAGWELLSAALLREEMPVAGTAVPVVLPANLFKLTAQAAAAGAGGGESRGPLPHPGDWVKLKHVTPRFVRGQLQLCFGERSNLLSRTAEKNSHTARAYAERLALRDGVGLNLFAPRNPESLLARALRAWQALPLRTLRQVLMQQDTCDCTPSRVVARVVAVLHPALPPAAPQGPAGGPSTAAAAQGSAASVSVSAEDRCLMSGSVVPASSLRCEGEVVPGSGLDRGRNGRMYALALLLQDATASLRAVLLGGAANVFLWDIPPPDDPRVDDASPGPSQRCQQGQQHPPLSQSVDGGSGPGHSRSAGGVQTRSRAAAQSQGAAAAAAAAAAAQGQEQRSSPEAHQTLPGQGHDREAALERLVTVLRSLVDQRSPSGAWLECVLRPLYRDRRNPWQSAVYVLEHTRLRPSLVKPGPVGGAAPSSPGPSI